MFEVWGLLGLGVFFHNLTLALTHTAASVIFAGLALAAVGVECIVIVYFIILSTRASLTLTIKDNSSEIEFIFCCEYIPASVLI